MPLGAQGAHPPLWGQMYRLAESDYQDVKKYPVGSLERPGIGDVWFPPLGEGVLPPSLNAGVSGRCRGLPATLRYHQQRPC